MKLEFKKTKIENFEVGDIVLNSDRLLLYTILEVYTYDSKCHIKEYKVRLLKGYPQFNRLFLDIITWTIEEMRNNGNYRMVFRVRL